MKSSYKVNALKLNLMLKVRKNNHYHYCLIEPYPTALSPISNTETDTPNVRY